MGAAIPTALLDGLDGARVKINTDMIVRIAWILGRTRRWIGHPGRGLIGFLIQECLQCSEGQLSGEDGGVCGGGGGSASGWLWAGLGALRRAAHKKVQREREERCEKYVAVDHDPYFRVWVRLGWRENEEIARKVCDRADFCAPGATWSEARYFASARWGDSKLREALEGATGRGKLWSA